MLRIIRVTKDHSWVFFGRNDETPVLWPPHAKSWLIGKDPDAEKDWRQEEKGMRENETAGWHHQLDGREFEWTPGVGDGQGRLACCNSWGRKESDTTERLNWTELKDHKVFFFFLFFKFYFIFKLYNIDWFCHISKWIHHRHTCVPHPEPSSLLPPPSPYHPSGSSHCTSPKHPVSCIEPGLVTSFIYDIIHISMPFSQIISPSPSPTESKRLFYTSVSLLLSHIQGYCYHLSKFHIYALVYCIGVFLSGLLHSV